MVPDFGARIEAMRKAMLDVIMPALDTQDALAREQAQFVLANLAMLQAQFPYPIHFRLCEIRELQRLIADLLALGAVGIPELEREAREALASCAGTAALQLPSLAALSAQSTTLKRVADALVDTLQDPGGTSREAAQRVLAQAESAAQREQAWVASAGLGPQPEHYPSLATLLGVDHAPP